MGKKVAHKTALTPVGAWSEVAATQKPVFPVGPADKWRRTTWQKGVGLRFRQRIHTNVLDKVIVDYTR